VITRWGGPFAETLARFGRAVVTTMRCSIISYLRTSYAALIYNEGRLRHIVRQCPVKLWKWVEHLSEFTTAAVAASTVYGNRSVVFKRTCAMQLTDRALAARDAHHRMCVRGAKPVQS
jgi:hypothetical protein